MLQSQSVSGVPNEDSPAEAQRLVRGHEYFVSRAAPDGDGPGRREYIRKCEGLRYTLRSLPLFKASRQPRSMGFRTGIPEIEAGVHTEGEPRIVPCLSRLFLSIQLATSQALALVDPLLRRSFIENLRSQRFHSGCSDGEH